MLVFYNDSDAMQATADLQEHLEKALRSGRTLWLVPGGSNIPLVVQVMRQAPRELQTKLAIMLTDERYGEFGHADSNFRQLVEAGFEAGKARVVMPLTPQNLSAAKARGRYERALQQALEYAETVIGQFGVGADGHIAGILPGSSAVGSQRLVEVYNAGEFQRLTLTPEALKHITTAFAFVYGESKRQALLNLQKKLPLTKQPAQILKQIPEAYVYNGVIGETT